jgi:hypothetical protein
MRAARGIVFLGCDRRNWRLFLRSFPAFLSIAMKKPRVQILSYQWVYFDFYLVSPSAQGRREPFLCSHHGYNSGTVMLKQHARSEASCMLILGDIIRNKWLFRLFPCIFIHRTEEVEGSNPPASGRWPRQVRQPTLRNSLAWVDILSHHRFAAAPNW